MKRDENHAGLLGTLAIAFGLLYWPLEALIHAYIFDERTFSEQLFAPEVNEIWMRSLIAFSFILFGIYAKRAMARQEQLINRLRDQEARARRVVDAAKDAYVCIDSESIIIGWNPSAEKLFGWRFEEANGRLLEETIIPERFREAHRKGLASYLKSGIGPRLYRTIETVAIRRDGTEFAVEMSVVPMGSSKNQEFYAFIREIGQ